jgi:hypothetical protein
MEASVYPKLQLFISARKLVDLDTFSKSDPFVIVSERSTPNEEWS